MKKKKTTTCILLRRRQSASKIKEWVWGRALTQGQWSLLRCDPQGFCSKLCCRPCPDRVPARSTEEALPRTQHRLRVTPHCSYFLPRGWGLAQSEEQRGWHPHQNQTSDQKYWTGTVYTRKLSHKNIPSRS